MANKITFVVIIIQCILISCLLQASSLPSTEHIQFTVLNVSDSLHRAHNVFFSLNPHPKQKQTHTNSIKTIPSSSASSSHVISVKLYPRTVIEKPTNVDYKTLTESRLSRDRNRVNSLTSKLEISMTGISRADMKPTYQRVINTEHLEAPVSSGTSQGSGEYFTRLGVGSPSRDFYMVVDTGSDVTWLQCSPCNDCYQQTDTIFDPATSSTYSPLACGAPQCSSLEVSACGGNGVCMYQVSYGDGSFTIGDFVTETVSFGSSSPLINGNGVAIGCGHDNEGLFVGAAGLLGLGGGALSLTSQIKAASFSYCLVDRDTARTSTLEFNSARPENSVSTRLIKSSRINTFYYVSLTGISVGGEPLPISSSLFSIDAATGRGGVIVDSGTAITRLTSEAYATLRDAFVALTKNLPSTGSVTLFDTCYDLNGMGSVRVPTVAFVFDGGREMSLPAKNYLIPVDSAGTFCFAFAATTSALSIIGNVQQQGTRVHFDLVNSQVSFSQNSC